MRAYRKSKTRVPTQLHGFFHPGGEERKKKEGSAFSLAKRCIIENHLECDYLQPPSNAVHLAPLTWWITSFYDGNGSLRRAGIKGGERRGLAGLLSLVIGDRFSAAFCPPDGSPDFSDRFDTRPRHVSALWRPLSWLAASLGPIYLLLPIAKRKVDGDDESFAS